MVLQRQMVDISLGLGLDTKSDSKQIIPGKLLTLENGVLRKNKQIRKRDGNRKLSNLTIDGTEITSGTSLATYKDELLLYANQNLYSYSDGASSFIDKGACVSAIVSTKQIIKNTATQVQADSAGANGLSIYAWEDTRGGVRCSIYDELSGTPILVDVSVDASANRPRCLAFSGYLYVFYYKSGALYARRVNPLSATGLDAAVTLSSSLNTSNPNYDVYGFNDIRMMIVYNVQGASEIGLFWVDADLSVLSGVLAEKTISEAGTNSLAIIKGSTNLFYICYHNNTDGVRCTIVNSGGNNLVSPFTVENITASNVVNITGHQLSSTSIRLYYQVSAAATYNTLIRYNDITSSGVAGTAADFLRSVGLYSKAFEYVDSFGDSYYFVNIVYQSTLQSTFFTVRSDRLIVAKQQPSNASGLTTRPILANVWRSSDSKFTWAITNKTQIVSENSTIFTPTGVSSTSLDFAANDVFRSAELGQNLMIVGGVLQMYDGQSVVEHGFHLYPENVTATPQTSGGSLADGTYQVCVVYEWTDNQGQIHRSAPSVPVEAVVSGGGGSGSIDVTVSALRLTGKAGDRSNVSVVGYVTESAGSIFYRYTSITSPTLNSISTDTITLPDVTSVSISNEILYTTGGVLENIAAPACSVIEVFKNRIFIGGLEDTTSYQFSKENRVGDPVEFSDTFVRKISPNGGPITAFGVLDDKLLMLKGDRYFFTFGDGPNNLGQDTDFAEPQFVTADIGCEVASSIVRTPIGLMFKSSKGIYLIDSTLQAQYIGADVEAYNSNTVTSGVLVALFNEVRFTTSEGPTLIYDYYQKQWSTSGKMKCLDSVSWQNKYVFLRTTGLVYYDVPGYYKDDESSIKMKIGTGWISLAGLSGYQRVLKLAILGEYKSPHVLKVSIGYDFSPAYSQIAYIDPDNLIPTGQYGDDATFGAEGTVYGGNNNAYRFIVNLKKQKCQSIRFLIEEVISASTTGSQESLNITALSLLVGIKTGITKIKTAQTVSTGGQ